MYLAFKPVPIAIGNSENTFYFVCHSERSEESECYCTKRNRFLVPRNDKFPNKKILTGSGANFNKIDVIAFRKNKS